MNKCNICPRNCNIDRTKEQGFCLCSDQIVISKVMLHQYEEPMLTNKSDKGSGAIFFSGCNLKCVYCQNYDISHNIVGKTISINELVEIFKKLESAGAGNIDLVTPTHFTNQIIDALKIYKPKVPVIWNSSGYEKPQTLKKLKGLVDIFLIDFKYSDDQLAIKYSKAPNYVKNAKKCLREIKKQQNRNFFENGKLLKGIIVRHMVLPTHIENSKTSLDIIKEILGKDVIVSIMSQYTPMGKAENYPEINRKINNLEYKIVLNHALKLDLNNCLVQDLESATSKYTPNFYGQIFDI